MFFTHTTLQGGSLAQVFSFPNLQIPQKDTYVY